MQVRILTWAMPPVMCPTRQRETRSSASAMLPFCMISPARMKKGTASSGKLSREEKTFCIMNSGGRSPAIMPTMTPRPRAAAMGTLRISSSTMVTAVRRMGSSIQPHRYDGGKKETRGRHQDLDISDRAFSSWDFPGSAAPRFGPRDLRRTVRVWFRLRRNMQAMPKGTTR